MTRNCLTLGDCWLLSLPHCNGETLVLLWAILVKPFGGKGKEPRHGKEASC